MLIRQFTRRWRREYLLNLREKHLIKSKPQGNRPIKVGDVVILKNNFTKRAFWKLAIVKSLISSKDGINRAAIVKIASTDKSSFQCLRRSIKHLYPIEVNANSTKPIAASASQDPKDDDDLRERPIDVDDMSTTTVTRPRRNAAATGELIRRICQN